MIKERQKITDMKSVFIVISILLFSAGGYAQKFERKAGDANGLVVGEKVEAFSASDQKRNTFRLDKALEDGPVVLIFYRGHWCPVCNRQLGELEAELPRITEAGGRVVAVSPEKPDYIEKTIEKTGASYTLLYDKDYKISNAFDVTYLPGGLTRTAYSFALGSDFNDAYDDDKPKLPIPATYIIDTDGTIAWRHFNPDYKERATVDQIVKALRGL